VLGKAQRFLHRFETYLLAILLMALLLLSVLQIILRVFFNDGFLWAETVGRQGVLWLGLLGALGATRDKKHIAIDALARFLPAKLQTILWAISQIAACAVCAALAWYGWQMVQFEREAPGIFVANIPSWWPMCLFAAGFALMSLRFLLAAFKKPEEAMPAESAP
jgi:C4-dicarboxylate transporter, DctQ subunit